MHVPPVGGTTQLLNDKNLGKNAALWHMLASTPINWYMYLKGIESHSTHLPPVEGTTVLFSVIPGTHAIYCLPVGYTTELFK